MDNHYHLLISVGEQGLADGMCELNTGVRDARSTPGTAASTTCSASGTGTAGSRPTRRSRTRALRRAEPARAPALRRRSRVTVDELRGDDRTGARATSRSRETKCSSSSADAEAEAIETFRRFCVGQCLGEATSGGSHRDVRAPAESRECVLGAAAAFWGVRRPPLAVIAPHWTQFDGASFTSTVPSPSASPTS